MQGGERIKDTMCQRFTVKRGLRFAQMEIEWAQECISELKEP